MREDNQGLVVFSHGKESGPHGTKIRVLSGIAEKHGWATDSIDYTDMMDPDERVTRLLDATDLERVSIVHGWHDELIPPDNILRYASRAACDLHLLPADHRLSAVLPELADVFERFLARLR